MITKEMVEVLKMWSVEMEPYFRVIPKSKWDNKLNDFSMPL
jgi:hypothetical protein